MKAISKTGFIAEIPDNVTDDWELVEMLADADSGKPSALISAMKKMLGEKNYKALKEHVRKKSEDGVVHTSVMSEEFRTLMESVNSAKN